jgi:hypothetical protein
MGDRLLPEQSIIFGPDLAVDIPRPSEGRWLVILWMLSLVIVTTGWWAGLAWAAVWLVERAVS